MEEGVGGWRPRARGEGLLVREVEGEVLVYDLESHRAVCLNRAAARVWRLCDGRTTVGGIGRALGDELPGPGGEEVVWLALEQLGRGRLLSERVRRPEGAGRVTRRELMRRLGLAAAATLPLVTSVVAPTAAQAASLLGPGQPCNSSLECGSGVCSAGTCA
jgi:Coenzyme PQQ synthesis protein D (PqqD)